MIDTKINFEIETDLVRRKKFLAIKVEVSDDTSVSASTNWIDLRDLKKALDSLDDFEA